VTDPYGAIRNGHGPGVRKVSLPLGTVVIRAERVNGRTLECRYVKIKMEGPTGLRWMLYARWWWERNRGPVPRGQLVLHLDGDTMNDAPENLALGTPGDKAVLPHIRDEAWARAQYDRASQASQEVTRFRGKLHRLDFVHPTYWYPALDEVGVVFNIPFRRRKPLLEAFGIDTREYPPNGAARAILAKLDPNVTRPVRGRDLKSGILSTYIRYDPELEAGSHGTLEAWEEARIRTLRGTPVWELALRAAKTDLRKR